MSIVTPHEHDGEAWDTHRYRTGRPKLEAEEHEHDSEAWTKHRRRMGQKKTLKIHGRTLASWAADIAAQDAQRIHSAISIGLTAGEDNTDVAHRVIGTRRLNGANGATEITRQHILRLGKGLISKRKTRMGGASADVRTK